MQCKGQSYKTAEIILVCHQVLCLFCTVIFTNELNLIAKRRNLSCHYECDYSLSISHTVMTSQTVSFRYELACKIFNTICV